MLETVNVFGRINTNDYITYQEDEIVAVVQISKIQVRRGQKNQGSGLPQLASGEFGWAVDTRELYIGNGSVAEGAPAVGNTKVLTQFDDLFSLADSYVYRSGDLQTGFDSSQPTTRTLQERLDERVSVKAFGVKGDGITDDTDAFQRALDQLYLNTNTPVTLLIPAGTYILSSTIYLPPSATLVGEGKTKTKLCQTNSNSYVFQTINSTITSTNRFNDPSTFDASSTTENQAKNIKVEGMTLEVQSSQTAVLLQSCRDSVFKDLEIKGTWTQVDAPVNNDIALRLNQLSGPVASDHNMFDGCVITGFSYGVISDWDINYNSWNNCKFDLLSFGVVFGNDMSLGSEASGTSRGPSDSYFNNCMFSNINKNAIKITNGYRNIIEKSSFESVANEAGADTLPQYPVIVVSKKTNKVINCYFSRTAILASGSGITNIPYYPEVEGPSVWDLNFENSVTFGSSSNVRVFRLPNIANKSFEIDYTLVSQNYVAMRSGKLDVVINGYNNDIEVSDSYDYVGDLDYSESISFTGYLADADSDASYDTVELRVTSTMPIDDQTEIKYTVRTKTTDII